jgi:hypothetical protein
MSRRNTQSYLEVTHQNEKDSNRTIILNLPETIGFARRIRYVIWVPATNVFNLPEWPNDTHFL